MTTNSTLEALADKLDAWTGIEGAIPVTQRYTDDTGYRGTSTDYIFPNSDPKPLMKEAAAALRAMKGEDDG